MGKDFNPHKPRKPFKCVEGIGSEAMRRLNAYDLLVLMMMYEKFNGMNRNGITLPFKEAQDRISKPTFFKSILRLMAYGFIRRVKKGDIGPKQGCSVYGLSDLWRKYEDKPAELQRIEKSLQEAENLINSKEGKQRNRRRVLLKEQGVQDAIRRP